MQIAPKRSKIKTRKKRSNNNLLLLPSSYYSWSFYLSCFLFLFLTFSSGGGGVALGRVGAHGDIDIVSTDGDNGGGKEEVANGKNEKVEEIIGKKRDPPTPPPSSSDNNNNKDKKISCDCRWGGGDNDNDNDANKNNTPKGARLAYLITVHNKRIIDDATHLFDSIRSPGTIILLHIDTKLSKDTYENSILRKQMENCPCGSIVHVDSIHNCQWGRWSMNSPTHWAMEILSYDDRFAGKWDVFMNLSGDTMPVYNPYVIQQLFDPKNGPLKNTNFVTSSSCETGLLPTNVHIFPHWWHKWEHYNTNPSGDPVITYLDDYNNQREQAMVTHFGSQWMALQPDFTKYVVSSLKIPNSLASRYRDFLIGARKLMSDETFIPTLLVHTAPYNETLPKLNEDGSLESLPSMKALRYERMDEHVPSAFGYFPAQQRYEVPESSEADEPRIWGPYFLGMYDMGDIIDSGALFIRKVSIYVDPNIVYMLPVSKEEDLPYMRWPRELKISPKPNWEDLKADIARKAKEKEEKKIQEEEENKEEMARNDKEKEEHIGIIHDEQ